MSRITAAGIILFATCAYNLLWAGEPQPKPSGWRNDGTGVYSGTTLPLTWSGKKNILWETEIGWSYSSVIASGEHVYALVEPKKVLCVRVADGKIAWEKELTAAILPEAQRGNVKSLFAGGETSGNSAVTPVVEGNSLYVVLGNGIVACLDTAKGEIKWAQHVNKDPTSNEGRSASPLLVGGKLLVHLTNLIAFDPASGKLLWEADAVDSYGTSGAGKIGDTDIVVTPRGKIVRVSDGKILAENLGDMIYITPIIQNGILYMIGETCAAYQLPDKVTNDKVEVKEIWKDSLNDEVYASPVIHDGLIYALPNSGKLLTFDMKNKTKTETATALGEGAAGEIHMYPSVIVAGKHLYLFNDKGKGAVLELGSQPKLVGNTQLDEGSASTPAVLGKRMFVRTGSYLTCIGE